MPRGVYARKEIHTDDMPIEQKTTIIGEELDDRSDEIVIAHQMPEKKAIDELAFNEEPVRIRLEPSAEKNAPTAYPF